MNDEACRNCGAMNCPGMSRFKGICAITAARAEAMMTLSRRRTLKAQESQRLFGQPGPAADPVDAPPHYTAFPVEVIQLTEHLNFCRGNAVKYLCRAGKKAGADELEDLKKARWYVEREIARLEKGK